MALRHETFDRGGGRSFVLSPPPDAASLPRYGRGQSGGQVRDDRRVVYDAARANRDDEAMIEAAPADPEAAEKRRQRFLEDTAERQEAEEPKVTGAKRRRRDDDDDDDKSDDDE